MRTLIVSVVTICIVAATYAIQSGELSDFHFKNARNKLGSSEKSRSHEEVSSTNHGISEIGIERTVCFGTCPAYTFIVKNDGSFRYKGGKYARRQGEFTGNTSVWRFHQIAKFIKDSGYMEMEDAYTRAITDNPTTFTMVVMNGKRKVVSNYADAAPMKLWAIEQLVDSLMEKAAWDEPRKEKSEK